MCDRFCTVLMIHNIAKHYNQIHVESTWTCRLAPLLTPPKTCICKEHGFSMAWSGLHCSILISKQLSNRVSSIKLWNKLFHERVKSVIFKACTSKMIFIYHMSVTHVTQLFILNVLSPKMAPCLHFRLRPTRISGWSDQRALIFRPYSRPDFTDQHQVFSLGRIYFTLGLLLCGLFSQIWWYRSDY